MWFTVLLFSIFSKDFLFSWRPNFIFLPRYQTYHRWKFLGENGEELSKLDFIEATLKRLLTDVENPNLKRIILIARYVNISLRKLLGDNYFLDYIKCLNLYVSTMPEATISIKDVENFLSLTLDDRAFYI